MTECPPTPEIIPFLSMDIHDLRLLLEVARHGNLSRAAEALGLSQPSVSRQLRDFEQIFQTPLFHRTGRGVQPTEVGLVAIKRAEELIASFDNYVAEIRENAQGPSGVVSIALLTAYMREFAVDLFEAVQREHPRIMLRMVESFSVQHEQWLATGQVDIALVTQYHRRRVAQEDIVSQSSLALVATRGLLPSDLVLPAPSNGLRQRLEEEAARQKIKLRVIFEADSIEAQQALMRRYPCCVVWSEHLARQTRYHQEFDVCRIVEPTMPRYVVLRTTSHHPLTWATREVAFLLRRLIRDAHDRTRCGT
jgi:LysR family nitrogen assimilation transcriptional regulator